MFLTGQIHSPDESGTDEEMDSDSMGSYTGIDGKIVPLPYKKLWAQ